MRQFGIIGWPVGHSFSPRYFSEKFEQEGIDAVYSLYPIARIEEVRQLLEQPNLAGLNVTLPYKTAVMAYLDELDETAREIGAVNVIKKCKVQGAECKVQGAECKVQGAECKVQEAECKVQGAECKVQEAKLVGYNTDAIGFMDSIRPLLRPEDKNALILGTGGVSRAVRYGLRKLGVEVRAVSRHPQAPSKEGDVISYEELREHPEMLEKYTVIVNCTPLGMTPDIDTCPDIPYDRLGPQHLLYDCVYTPAETLFLRKGREHGCRTQNGMEMLYGQAVAAWRIWEEVSEPPTVGKNK